MEKYDIELFTNSSLVFDLELMQSGSAVDITDYVAQFYLKEASSDTYAYLDLSTYCTISGSLGKIAVNVPVSIVDDIVPGTYVYDIRIYKSSTSSAQVLIGGHIYVSQGISDGVGEEPQVP